LATLNRALAFLLPFGAERNRMAMLLSIFVAPLENIRLWALVVFCVGAYCFVRGFRLLQRRRLILDTPSSKIRSASIGLVELNGLAVGPYTMPAPITGHPCYYYRTIAWQWTRSGRNSRWEKVADESLHLPFYLDDNTGQILVNPQGAELDIHRDFHEEYGGSVFFIRETLPVNVSSFLTKNGIANDKRLKIEEYCIKPKNSLFILGTLTPNPGLKVVPTPVHTISKDPSKLSFAFSFSLGSSHEDAMLPMPDAAMVSPLQGMDSQPESFTNHSAAPQDKVVAALNKAGITNPAAWAAAGVPYSGMSASPAVAAATAAAPAQEFDLNPRAVLMKGEKHSAFFISWRSQRDVARSLEWKSILMIWGGPALILLSISLLLLH
jgi:E3 Ubiquitin ligase